MIRTQNQRSYSSEDADRIIMLHNNGVTAKEIAAQMGRTTNAIHQFLCNRRKRDAKLGREVKPDSEVPKPEVNNRKEMTARDMIKALYNMGYRIENNKLVHYQKHVIELNDIVRA